MGIAKWKALKAAQLGRQDEGVVEPHCPKIDGPAPNAAGMCLVAAKVLLGLPTNVRYRCEERKTSAQLEFFAF
jgi:hypothetical protein